MRILIRKQSFNSQYINVFSPCRFLLLRKLEPSFVLRQITDSRFWDAWYDGGLSHPMRVMDLGCCIFTVYACLNLETIVRSSSFSAFFPSGELRKGTPHAPCGQYMPCAPQVFIGSGQAWKIFCHKKQVFLLHLDNFERTWGQNIPRSAREVCSCYVEVGVLPSLSSTSHDTEQ